MPTYIAFAADGNEDIFRSDIKYYRLMQGWDAMKSKDFKFINPHEKGSAIRSWSQEETIKRTLRERLKMSNRLLLLVGETTRFDRDFVPYEIEYAIDVCKLPVIVCYVNESRRIIQVTDHLKNLIPKSLMSRINSEACRTIHIPFRQRILTEAINKFNKSNYPQYPFSVYLDAIYNRLYRMGEI